MVAAASVETLQTSWSAAIYIFVVESWLKSIFVFRCSGTRVCTIGAGEVAMIGSTIVQFSQGEQRSASTGGHKLDTAIASHGMLEIYKLMIIASARFAVAPFAANVAAARWRC